MTPPAPRPLALVLLLATTLSPAACGGKDVSPERIAAAARKTSEAGTARLAISGWIKWPGGLQRLSYSAEGAVDYARRAARLRLRPLRPANAGGLAPSDVLGELILGRGVAYGRSRALARKFRLDPDRWIRIPLVPRVEADGIDFRPIAESVNGVWSLGRLRATGGSVEKVGEERVRGVDTTRYRTTIERSRSRLKTYSAPTEVWIDKRGLVRRVEQRFSSGGPAKYATKGAQRVDFHDFGASVDVERPSGQAVIGSVAARVATALRDARRASGYRLYFLGRSYRGLPLRAVVRSRDPIGPPALPGEPRERTYVSFSFIYERCEDPPDPRSSPAGGGCGPSLEIKNGLTCARPPPRYARPAARLRGLPAYSLGSDYAALYPGRTSIVIFTSDPDAADVAAGLRSLDGRVRPGQPLPKAAPGALEGRLRCPH